MKPTLFSFIYLSGMTLFFILPGCIDLAEPLGQETELEISTNLQKVVTRAGTSFKTDFTIGEQIGLRVVKADNPFEAYRDNDDYLSLVSTYNGVSWENSIPVHLNAEKATVIAVYPPTTFKEESDSSGDFVFFPIESNTQTEYLFGKPAASLDASSNTAHITMKHLLSAITFKIRWQSSEPGQLTKIEIGDKFGTFLFRSKGLYDIYSGITYSDHVNDPDPVRVVLNLSVNLSSEYSEPITVLLLPQHAIPEIENYEFVFTVSGQDYRYLVPSSTFWDAGINYHYNVTISNEYIVIDKVDIEDWGTEEKGEITIQ